MGLNSSRNEKIDLEVQTQNRTIRFWEQDDYCNSSPNLELAEGQTTLNPSIISNAVIHIGLFIKVVKPSSTGILEVCAGNGIVAKTLSSLTSVIATDFKLHPFRTYRVEKLLSHEAVEKYMNDPDIAILLMVSPPPETYSDYYAIKSWERRPETKYVIFIGELGASDGGRGMYRYMIYDSDWRLVYRVLLCRTVDPLIGPVEKELFIFAINIEDHVIQALEGTPGYMKTLEEDYGVYDPMCQ